VLDLLGRIRDERGTTLVLVTHDADVAARADRVVRMLDGRVDESSPPLAAIASLRAPTLRPVRA
jgi:putative ABC transport system ATP-binding protein